MYETALTVSENLFQFNTELAPSIPLLYIVYDAPATPP